MRRRKSTPTHALHGGTRSWTCVYALARHRGKALPTGEPCVSVLQRFRQHQADGDTLTSAQAGQLIDVLTHCCIVARPGSS